MYGSVNKIQYLDFRDNPQMPMNHFILNGMFIYTFNRKSHEKIQQKDKQL